MQRDLLLLGEMIAAAERASELVSGITVEALQADRLRSESLLGAASPCSARQPPSSPTTSRNDFPASRGSSPPG